MSRKGSSKPVQDGTPEWVTMLPREAEAKVIELAKTGMQPAVIGLTLRDQFGVPSVHDLCGKKLGTILAEANLAPGVPRDLQNLIHRAISVAEHIRANRKDLHNKRGLELIEARIRKLAKYYQARGELPMTWKYTRDGARLLVD